MEAAVAKKGRKRLHSQVSVFKEPNSSCYYYRVMLNGRRYKRSTGKTNYDEALLEARLLAAKLQQASPRITRSAKSLSASLADSLALCSTTLHDALDATSIEDRAKACEAHEAACAALAHTAAAQAAEQILSAVLQFSPAIPSTPQSTRS